MPPKSARPRGSQTLLTFFKRSAPPSSGSTGKEATKLPIATNNVGEPCPASADDDEVGAHLAAEEPQPPPRKRMRPMPSAVSQDRPNERWPKRAQQWRYEPAKDGGQPSTAMSSHRSLEEDQRHHAFRKRLLGADDPIKRRDAFLRQQQEDEESTTQESEEVESINPRDVEGEQDEQVDKLSEARTRAAAFSGTVPGNRKAIKYTPLEQQVVELKNKYRDVLLLFEVGYKFVAYEDDAVAAAKELNIACYPKHNLRQASIPTHRLHIHARRLVNAGYKVGVVRQTETAALKAASSNASKPFTRQLSELYTASTWVESMEVDEDKGEAAPAQNSLIAIVERLEGSNYGGDERVSIGLISVQTATGLVVFDQFADSSMRSELETRIAHLQPAELLLPPLGKLSQPTEKLLRHLAGRPSTSISTGLTATKVRTERTESLMSYNEAFSFVSSFYEKVVHNEMEGDLLLDANQLEGDLDGMRGGRSGSFSKPKNDKEVGEALTFIMKMPQLAIIALATSLQHLQSFGLSSIFHTASSFISFQARSEMLLSTGTLYNLELFTSTDGTFKGSLFWLLDKCKTIFGKRLLRKWIGRPLTDIARLKERTDAVSELLEAKSIILQQIPELLLHQPDLEKGLARILYGRATPSELANVLLALNRISEHFDTREASHVGTESPLLNESIAALPRIKIPISRALSEINLVAARLGEKENMFVEGKYPQLQDEKNRIALVDSDLREHLIELRKVLKRPTLEYTTVSAIECLVEVKVSDVKKVPADWLRMSATKSVVRFHTPDIMQLLKARNRHRERLEAEAAKCYQSFLQEICESSSDLRNCITALGTLDVLTSLAEVAGQPGYVKPTYVEGEGLLSIRGLRHPMSEVLRDDYVPNDIELDGNNRGVILTGANMGGKSSTVRALALCIILGQIGSYVPADSATMTIHDAVLTRMGASDELAKGRSTFMVEAEEAAEIMRVSTSRSLVILDEMGRGTSTFDGQAIASSILIHLMTREEKKRPTTLFITHYTSLCKLAEGLSGVRNMHMQYVELNGENGKKKDVVFLYKLKEGPAGSSFGIHCASLAGLPQGLLEVASKRAKNLQVHTEFRLRKKRSLAARNALKGALIATVDEDAVKTTRAAVQKLGIAFADESEGGH